MPNNVRLNNILKAAMLVDKKYNIRINSGEHLVIPIDRNHAHIKAMFTIDSFRYLIKRA